MPMDEDNDDGLGGRSRRRREAREAHYGQQLVDLKDEKLDEVPLPEDVRAAVTFGRSIRSYSARKRQIGFINRLLRDLEPAQLTAIASALNPPRPQASFGRRK